MADNDKKTVLVIGDRRTTSMLALSVMKGLGDNAFLQEETFEFKRSYYPWDTVKQEQAKSKKIGRNEPCPCGRFGKKYKKCCGR